MCLGLAQLNLYRLWCKTSKQDIMQMLNTKFKAIIMLLLFVAAVVPYNAFCAKQDEVIAEISPQPVVVGEHAELYLKSIAGFPEVRRLPVIPGLQWSSTPAMQSKRTTIVNSKRATTFNTVYAFTVNREGTIQIPSMKVKIGHLVKKLNPVTFKAYKQKLIDSKGNATNIDELLYVSAIILNDRDYLYLGEEVPLDIRMYSVRGLPVTCAWPKLNIENIVLKNYGQLNPDSPHFIPPVRRTVKLKNQLYNVDIFKTSLRAISPGTLKGKITIPCEISVPRGNNQRRKSRNPFADFFSDSFSSYRKIQYKLVTDIPEKKIRNLPDIPTGTIFLGLVGEWKIKIALSSIELKSGEPVDLIVDISGSGTLDTLVAPELKLPGFRVYPPEVKKSNISQNGNGKAEIRYALIPREEGPVNLYLNFSTFSPTKQAYNEKKYNRSFSVKKGDNISSAVVDDSAPLDDSGTAAQNTKQKAKVRHGILYLKRKDAGGIFLPLYRNKLMMILLFILLGPIILVFAEFFYFKRNRLTGDPLLRRKNSARRRKKKIIEKLHNTSADNLHHVIRSDITPYFNDLLGYPPGTSTAELADKVNDVELAECLHSGSASSYMPGGSDADPENIKHNLLKSLQKLSIFILCLFFVGSVFAGSAVKDGKSVDLNDPLAAYDTGNFKTAEKFYQAKLNPKQPDPSVLYNLGNCYFQQGNFPEALVCYERARRIDPTDSDIIENLNYIRRKLILPEVDKSQNPLDSIRNFRDSFRPDSWILMAAIAWSLCWISILLRRYLSHRKWISSLSICSLILALSIFAYITQINTTYSSKNAIVIKKGIPVYSLPTTTSRKSEFNLRAGSEVKIEEERHNWVRIRDEQSEGWIKSDAVKKLWPYL
jgi:tetratricopeptide (TPR) repeat protein